MSGDAPAFVVLGDPVTASWAVALDVDGREVFVGGALVPSIRIAAARPPRIVWVFPRGTVRDAPSAVGLWFTNEIAEPIPAFADAGAVKHALILVTVSAAFYALVQDPDRAQPRNVPVYGEACARN